MFERVKHGVLFLFALVALGLVAWAPAHARACSCIETTFDRSRADAAAIFEGRVVGMEVGEETTLVHFRVTQAWRGVDHETVEVRTPSHSAMCGFAFQEGTVYLVYAQAGEGGELRTGLCSRTSPMDDETAQSDRQSLGSGTIPVDVEDAPTTSVPEERPARGGCASCAVQRAAMTPMQTWLAWGGFAWVVARVLRRRGR